MLPTHRSNANILPAIFWFIFHALTDPDLEKQVVSELRPCFKTQDETTENCRRPSLDVTELSKRPLLQSVYAEVLRLYNAIAFTRVSEDKDFDLEGYTVKAGTPMVLFSRPSAMNEEVWAQAGRASKLPLSEFDAERFLVASSENLRSSGQSSSSRGGSSFSLDNLAGIWTPYGGGHWLCPGRHFAKIEILSTVALFFSRFEIQLLTDNNLEVQPDMWWFPVGGLPPNKKVPFRIRKRPGCPDV